MARTDTAAQGARSRPRQRGDVLIFAGLTLLLFVMLFARSMNRDLDPDEHQFVAPPALLAQFHLLPYRDYPYFHMPDLVFILAGLTGWTSWKLLAARTVAVLCGTGTVALLFAAAWRTLVHLPTRCRWIVAGGVCLIFINGRLFTYTDGWAWNHDSAVLCALAAVLLHGRGLRTGSIASFAGAGFLAGLALGIRLSFALLPIPLAISLCIDAAPLSARQRLLALLAAVVAALLALSPAIYLAAIAPRAFWFGNLGYPGLSTAYYRTWERHGMTFLTKIALTLQKFVTDPGDAALLIGFVAALGWAWRDWARWSTAQRQRFRLLLGVLGVLWVGVMGPTPIQPQYNYMLVPFMVLVMFESAAAVDLPRLRSVARITAVAALLLAAVGLPRWYWGVLRLPMPNRWTTVERHRLAEWINTHTRPTARVLTIEPAIPLEAGRAIYPQYAVGRFVLLVTPYQPADQRARTGMVGPHEVPALLAQQPPDAILIQNVRPQDQVDRTFIAYARRHNYHNLSAPDGKHELWLR